MSNLSKRMLFAYLVSEINISKYKQKKYAEIVKKIYYNIFGKKKKWKLKNKNINHNILNTEKVKVSLKERKIIGLIRNVSR